MAVDAMGGGGRDAARIELVKRLLAQGKVSPADLPIQPRPAGTTELPLSFAQQELWVIDQIDPGTIAYNLAVPPLRLEGRLDAAALARALDEAVRRHEILRTTVETLDGQPVQRVADHVSVTLALADLSDTPHAEVDSAVRRAMQGEMERPFDLRRGPLLRATLLRLGEQTNVLLLTMHHMVFDAVSMGLFLGELGRLYTAFAAGSPSPLAPPALQYGDFALAQRRWTRGAAFERQLAYWRRRLDGAAELRLPMERAAQPGQGDRTMRESVVLPRELSAALKTLGRREGVTPFALLASAFIALLHRYAGQDDVVIGTPVTTRSRPELEAVIGFFVNMVVLRTDCSGRPGFRELLRRVREVTLGAMDHAQVPFDLVVRELGVHRRVWRNPLFQVAFAFEGDPSAALDFGDLTTRLMRFHSGPGEPAAGGAAAPSAAALESAVSRFDIEAYARDENDCLSLELSVTERLGRGTLRQMLAAFDHLCCGIVADPERPLVELPLLGESGRRQIVEAWNRTATAYPREAGVPALFEAQARRAPDAPALEYGAERLSYGELNARANRLACHLRGLGVAPEVPVGLSMERSPELIVAMLAILKAGGAYVPLDPDYPAERLSFMLGNAGVPVVVTQASVQARLPRDGAVRFVVVDDEAECIALLPADDEPAAARPDGLAYVVYTSGSTGTPKGVQVRQRSIVRLVCATDYLQIAAGDRVAQVSVASFDAATFEIWGPLLNGGCVVGVPRELSLSPDDFAAFLARARIAALFLTTALFNQMARCAPAAFAPVGCVLFGGEACDPAAVRTVLHSGAPGRLLHVYGPTEVTTFATAHEVRAVDETATTVPIGRPIANTTAYVLDEAGAPVPVGVTGELYLGGDGVARGYLNRPGLTAQHFVADRWAADPAARLYRTGDFVRLRADGAIEFVGRRDGQVKVRGYRIELGEIEAALRRLAPLQEAAVIVREDDPGDRRVVAYAVPRRDAAVAVTAEGLRATLRAHLPDHLVPSSFVVIDRLPLNANGKVDRAALPAPRAERATSDAPAEPRSELERRIAKVWCEMLRVDQVGVSDNFFDLGGHSLLLVRTHARLRAELQLDCKVVDLFTYPTIETLARFLHIEPETDALADEARDRLSRRGGVAEPVAIIGMAGRFPGAASIEAFWDNLCAGRESIRVFSAEEMRAAGTPPELIADPNHVPARGCLDDADLFDAGLYGYSAREAEAIDPQQRLLLECASELLDRAGYDPERCGLSIGVYAGASTNTYLAHLQSRQALPESLSGLSRVLASGQDFLTTRLSYKLDLRGPSVNVQTACSTSLVAVHQACRALADFECDMALAGGVAVSVPLKTGHVYVEEGIGSRDGHCRAFDAAASGTVGGNGVALVMLKRLSDAQRDGDHIHALILGTATNNDGSAKVGYTAPSVEGQSRAIALAQAAAGVTADDIDYIEAHGTGTKLGDPIEIAALNRVFQGRARRGAPVWLSALKSSIGHLDAAAGVAGLIKTALSVEHGCIAPTLHFESPNPLIDFGHGPIKVNAELRPWAPAQGARRRAGVSSFGLGGTNAHAVLEQAPPREPGPPPSRSWQLLCLSARSAAALAQAGENLATHLRAHPELALADVAHTLQVGRREFAHRRIVVAADAAQAAPLLDGTPGERSPAGVAPAGQRAAVFLFSGQGSQYPGMGAGLYRSEPRFREAVDRCCDLLAAPLGLDLRTLLFPADAADPSAHERLRRTEYAQPALFTVGYATATWWLSIGVEPAAMLGHSVGEIVAACLAGVFTLEDALVVVAERGRLMGQMPAGAMLSVPLPADDVRALLEPALSIAGVNGPRHCVVSGPLPAIAALELQLGERGTTPRRLQTSHAFHSAMMDAAVAPLRRCVERVRLRPPQRPLLSNLSGDWLSAEQATDPGYWAQQMRQPVQFDRALMQLFGDASRVLVEVGPGTTLGGLARSHPARPAAVGCVASLRHPDDARDDTAVLLEAAGRLWLHGLRPVWSALQCGERRQRVVLPSTPFERRRYWIDADPAGHADLGPSLGDAARRSADPADWLYLPSWRRRPAPLASAALSGADWLVFADRHGLGEALADALRAGGSRVAMVSAGHDYVELGGDRYEIGRSARDHYERLLQGLAATGHAVDAIAHLWTVGPADRGDDLAWQAEQVELGFYSVVFLMQALARGGRATRLAVVASGTVDVLGGEAISPDRAMVLAPCKVAAMEQPQIRARAIDLQLAADPAAQALALARELCCPWLDPVVAYRGSYRWTQAIEPVATGLPPQRPLVLREGAAYLITGGLGGVGLEIAAHLARRVGRVGIALVGRSGLPPREDWARWVAGHGATDAITARIRRIQAIEALGASVLVCQADVADAAQMAAALAIAQAQLGPIAGVVHAAGAEKRGETLLELQRESCEAQWRPKRDGLRALEQVLAGRSLDFVVLHSSLAAVVGVAGFVSYTASHLYLDACALAHNRRGGTPWRTVNWDNWAGPELRAAPAPEFFLEPAAACEALERVLGLPDAPQVLVSSGDLQARIERWLARDTAAAATAVAGDDVPAAASARAHPRPALSVPYEAARSSTERTLVSIWQDTLGIDGIGVHDNFFELGGDSVLNIQITGKAHQAGLRLTPRQVFEHQTIAELALQAGASAAAEVGPLPGPLPLTPIQAWFLERPLARPQHFNLPLLLELRRPLELGVLERALGQLAEHHEALRLRYRRVGGVWEQRIEASVRVPAIESHDLAALNGAAQDARIDELGAGVQGGLDLTDGPLWRLAYFDLGPRRAARLLFVIHHLAIDMISWRILIEDLQTLVEAAAAGRTAALPARTVSLRQWAESLVADAAAPATQREAAYWRALADATVAPLPVDHEDGPNTAGSTARWLEALDAESTRALLTDLPRLHGCQVGDALLLALAGALCGWTGDRSLLVDVEGHGRDAPAAGLDTSRTVGWFTTMFPLRIELPPAGPPGERLGRLRAQRAAVPRDGIGYGVLRQLAPQPGLRAALAALPPREISFLYLGQFDQAFSPQALFAPVFESCGACHDPDGERAHLLEVNCLVSQGRLQVAWTYSRSRHREATVRRLAQGLMAQLRALIDVPRAAPAAYSGIGHSAADLAEIARQLGMQARAGT